MSFTYVVTDPTGQVRMLIPDRVEADAFWSDEEIEALLVQEGSNVKRAAAAALEAMASDEAYVQKSVRLMDITTDGPAVSTALLARAKMLREQADTEDEGTEGGAFDVAEMVVDDFGYRERLEKESQRDG